MATKRITCREWCKKNNVPIESLVANRGKDDKKVIEYWLGLPFVD